MSNLYILIQDEDNKKTGFPEGVAEKMLLRTFRHYQVTIPSETILEP